MATTACFIIVSRNDIPIYEAEVGVAAKREDAAQLHQFILHAALDVVQDLAWTTSAMYLKSVDRFNELVVSVYVTAGHTRLMLLHDGSKEFAQNDVDFSKYVISSENKDIGEKLSKFGGRLDYPRLTKELAHEIESLGKDAAIQETYARGGCLACQSSYYRCCRDPVQPCWRKQEKW